MKSGSKYSLILFFFIVEFISSCATNPHSSGTTNTDTSASTSSSAPSPTNTDTSYFTSTHELRSDKIPDSVFQMTHLKHLGVAGMDCDYGDNKTCWAISKIPEEIKNLKELQTLSLNVNSISDLPEELSQLHNLMELDLSDNPGLSDIEVVTRLHNLKSLSLFGCGLSKLPDNMGNLKDLKYLGLTGNNIDRAELVRITRLLPHCEVIFE